MVFERKLCRDLLSESAPLRDFNEKERPMREGPLTSFSLGDEGGVMKVPGCGGQSGEDGGLVQGEPGSVPLWTGLGEEGGVPMEL